MLIDTTSRKELRLQKYNDKLKNANSFYSHEVHPGRKAALYSFGLPGLGQMYNHKYWKLPIVYGAIGTSLYFTITNGQNLNRYNTALSLRLRDEVDEFTGILSEAQIVSRRNVYRKNTELSAILTGVLYGLNIVDAVVDAHLFKFDISDDLSFRWSPDILTGNNKVVPSIHLSLNFN